MAFPVLQSKPVLGGFGFFDFIELCDLKCKKPTLVKGAGFYGVGLEYLKYAFFFRFC